MYQQELSTTSFVISRTIAGQHCRPIDIETRQMRLRRIWSRACLLVAIAVIRLTELKALGDESRLADIRSQGRFHIQLIRTLEYRFKLSDNHGWVTQVDLHLEGTKFRIDRADTTGMQVLDRRISPLQSMAAYNDERSQNYNANDSQFILRDGNGRASYSVDFPQGVVYAWLRMPGTPPIRWDHINSSKAWEDRFASATSLGTVEEDGQTLEVVDFPQQVTTPCIFKVFFNPALGYLPVKYIRRVTATGETASTMEVRKVHEMVIDGHRIGLPMEVRFDETGNDGVSLKQTLDYVVDESSLNVNKEIDQSLFTLDPKLAKSVYDSDEQARLLAAAEKEHKPEAPNPPISQASSTWLIGMNLAALTVVLLAVAWFRRK